MMKFIFVSSALLLLVARLISQGNSSGPPKMSPFAMAISAKLCRQGNHPDSVAQQYFDCYQETITPGGKHIVACQDEVFQAPMNTESNIELGCSSKDKWAEYRTCVEEKLTLARTNIQDTMDKLNKCQAAAVGVPKSQIYN